MSKTIPGDLSSEIVKVSTRPFHIAKIEFPSGNAFLSETMQIDYNGDTYIEGALKIGSVNWSETGVQKAKITMLDNSGSILSIVLNNQVSGSQVSIWTVYDTGSGNTTPKMLLKGILEVDDISLDQVVIDVVAFDVKNSFFPVNRCTQENGFNYLMKSGQIIEWAGEKHEMVN